MPFAFDYETFLIQPGQAAPPAVCLAWTDEHAPVERVRLEHLRFDRAAARERLVRALEGEFLVGANVAFDLAVTLREWPDLFPLVFKAYEESRVYDVEIAQKLIDIGTDVKLFWSNKGSYSLGALAKRHLQVDLDKDTWRMKYGTLYDTPLSAWPEGAREYPRWDARVTFDIAGKQAPEGRKLADLYNQTRAAWWVHLMVCHGFLTDPHAVRALRLRLEREREEIGYKLRRYGLLKPTGERDTKAASARMVEACRAKGLEVKLTSGGESGVQKIALDEDACLASGDEALKLYARWTSLDSIWSKDLPALSKPIIQRRFDLAETGRTTCSGGKSDPKRPSPLHGFQLQNVRREPGVRECFVPRAGRLLLSVDYGQMELHTWSQACLSLVGHSEMAKALNAKVDVHMLFGCRVNGGTYEEAIKAKKKEPYKTWRQGAKAANFGYPGGLGARSFVEYARMNYGVILSPEESKNLKNEWQSMWPEARDYFAFVHSLCGGQRNSGDLYQLTSGRIRANVPFTEACNGFFQGLAADCAKDAGFRIAKACYVDERSPLYGSRIVNFIHDEFLVEVPEAWAHECADEVVRLMEAAGQRWCPDVPPRAEPALMRRWMKAAEPAYDDKGRLIPWEPS